LQLSAISIFSFIAIKGELADLIFVYFDPIGQALCKRTLNLVEQLNIKHPERLRFYLSKADDAGTESDRQRFARSAMLLPNLLCLLNRLFSCLFYFFRYRVMMQIVQELCKRPGLNKTGFDMPTIYIPNPNKVRYYITSIF